LRTVPSSDFKELYAIVTFSEEEPVLEVLNRSHFFNSYPITIDRMLQKVPQKKKPVGRMVSTQLFVGGIPNDVTQDEIVKLFSGYGKLKKLVMPMEKGRNRGFAFVTYESCDSANAVFDDLKNVRIRAKEVDLKVGRQGNEQGKTG